MGLWKLDGFIISDFSLATRFAGIAVDITIAFDSKINYDFDLGINLILKVEVRVLV